MIVLIPAHGGSKRLPGKNIRLFAGKPLIHWSIEMGLAMPEVTRTIVSTDDDDVARVSRRAGAEVRMRLATDETSTALVVKRTLDELAQEGEEPEAVVILRPSCPLRPFGLVSEAIGAFLMYGGDSVVSVSERRDKVGHLEGGFFHPDYPAGARSGDIAPVYVENGIVCVARGSRVRETGELLGKKAYPLVTDALCALGNIETALDFEIAEHLFVAHASRFRLPSAARVSQRRLRAVSAAVPDSGGAIGAGDDPLPRRLP
jgi:CMP-N-acetylneuraminic acid synthetase